MEVFCSYSSSKYNCVFIFATDWHLNVYWTIENGDIFSWPVTSAGDGRQTWLEQIRRKFNFNPKFEYFLSILRWGQKVNENGPAMKNGQRFMQRSIFLRRSISIPIPHRLEYNCEVQFLYLPAPFVELTAIMRTIAMNDNRRVQAIVFGCSEIYDTFTWR